MTTTKATHYGTCQICACLQKLPAGRLAVHGYTTANGFFQGVCIGSDHAPFETDKAFAAAHLDGMQKWIAENEVRVAALPVNRANAPAKQQLDGARSFVRFQTPLLAQWQPKELRPVAEVETEAAAKQTVNKGRNARARVLRDAKHTLSKLTDSWSAAFLSACDAAGISRDERHDTASAIGKWFDAFYYSTSAKKIAKFATASAPDDKAKAVVFVMLPLIGKIESAAQAVADAKAMIAAAN